ncbi:helix-turn-helix domain-containing protein [Acidobacteria bacterium AH-259-D05]|nr:helix-turn-helix domain-containing protein [Acidobacteria bacterium AH-259-D05]
MIGKPIVLIQIPNQRLFGTKAAAQYLGIHEQTLRKLTDLGDLPARRMGRRRVYRLEDLDQYIDSLPRWYDGDGEKSGTGKEATWELTV